MSAADPPPDPFKLDAIGLANITVEKINGVYASFTELMSVTKEADPQLLRNYERFPVEAREALMNLAKALYLKHFLEAESPIRKILGKDYVYGRALGVCSEMYWFIRCLHAVDSKRALELLPSPFLAGLGEFYSLASRDDVVWTPVENGLTLPLVEATTQYFYVYGRQSWIPQRTYWQYDRMFELANNSPLKSRLNLTADGQLDVTNVTLTSHQTFDVRLAGRPANVMIMILSGMGEILARDGRPLNLVDVTAFMNAILPLIVDTIRRLHPAAGIGFLYPAEDADRLIRSIKDTVKARVDALDADVAEPRERHRKAVLAAASAVLSNNKKRKPRERRSSLSEAEDEADEDKQEGSETKDEDASSSSDSEQPEKPAAKRTRKKQEPQAPSTRVLRDKTKTSQASWEFNVKKVMLGELNTYDLGKKRKLELLPSSDSKILVCRGFATEKECKALIDSIASWAPAKVDNPHTGQNLKSTERTNSVGTVEDAKLIRKLDEDLRLLFSDVFDHEDFVINRYGVGEEFGLHHDSADLEGEGGRMKLVLGRRDHSAEIRKFSGLLYLNTDFGGGGTTFPRLNVTVKPELGMLLLWCDYTLNSQTRTDKQASGLDIDMIHQAEPVVATAAFKEPFKYSLNMWFHSRSTRTGRL